MPPKEVSVVVRAIDNLTKPIQEMRGALSGFASGLKNIFAGIGALAVGSALLGFFKSTVKEAAASEESVSRLNTVLRTMGLSYKSIGPELKTYLDTLQRTTRFSDEDGQAAFTNLLIITGDYRKSLDLLTVSANVATARQVSLAEGATIVGKASRGFVKGLGDLGVTTKNAGDAVAVLTANTLGLAEAAGATFAGRVDILNNLWGEFKEKIGLAIIGNKDLGGSLDGLANTLVKLAGWIEKHSEDISAIVSGMVAFFEGAAKATSFFADQVKVAWQVVVGPAQVAMKLLGVGHQELAKTTVVSEAQIIEALGGGGKRRITLTVEQEAELKRLREKGLADRARAAKEADKHLLEAQIELTVKTLMLEKNWSEDHAKEWVKRQLNMGKSLGVQVTTLEDTYRRIDAANKKLGEGFEGIVPKVKKTETAMVELRRKSFDLEKALFELGIPLDEVGNANFGLAEETKKTAAALEQGGRAAIGMGQGLGVLDDQAAAALQNILTLGDSLSKLSVSGLGANLPGIIGGLSGLLGSIFAGDAERLAMIRRNAEATEKLARVNGELVTLNTPGRVHAGAEKLFAPTSAFWKGFKGSDSEKMAQLQVMLKGVGITLGELKALGKDYGFDLIDSKGKFDFSTLGALGRALPEIQFSSFGDTFRDQLNRISIGKGIGAIGAGSELGEVIGATGIGGQNAILGALQGLDLSSAGGSAEAVANLRQLFNNIGTLTSGDFGGLTGPEFLQAIESLIGLLTDSVADLGGVLVPAGIGTTLLPDIPVQFDLMTEQGAEQIDVLQDINAGIQELVTGQRAQSGDINVITHLGTSVDALNQALAQRYRLDQLAGGSAAR